MKKGTEDVLLNNTPILSTEDLTYIYQKGTNSEVTAIQDVSVDILQGELVGIIGHTGSGKSTLIEHFNALKKGTSGRVLLDGSDIWADKSKIRSVRFRVGVCFQYPEYQLFEETVAKDIAFGPKNMGLSEEEVNRRVTDALTYVGLSQSYAEKSPFDLSGGEKRRVAIAGIMAMEPQVLVLDEPCAGLDPKGRATVLQMIASYRAKTGCTVLLVSHSMEDVAAIADRILVMNRAHVAFFDTVDAVFSHAEELQAIGLDIPRITQLMLSLREKGIDVPVNLYTVQQAYDALRPRLKGGSRHAQ